MSIIKYVFVLILIINFKTINASGIPVDIFSSNYDLYQYLTNKDKVFDENWLSSKLDKYISGEQTKWYKSSSAILILLYRINKIKGTEYSKKIIELNDGHSPAYDVAAELIALNGEIKYLLQLTDSDINNRQALLLAAAGYDKNNASIPNEILSSNNQIPYNLLVQFVRAGSPYKQKIFDEVVLILNSDNVYKIQETIHLIANYDVFFTDKVVSALNESLLRLLDSEIEKNQFIGLLIIKDTNFSLEFDDNIKAKVLMLAYKGKSYRIRKQAQFISNQLLLFPFNSSYDYNNQFNPATDQNTLSISSHSDIESLELLLIKKNYSKSWEILFEDLQANQVLNFFKLIIKNKKIQSTDVDIKINYIINSNKFEKFKNLIKMNSYLYLIDYNKKKFQPKAIDLYQHLNPIQKTYCMSLDPELFEIDDEIKFYENESDIWLAVAYWINIINSTEHKAYFNRNYIPEVNLNSVDALRKKALKLIKE